MSRFHPLQRLPGHVPGNAGESRRHRSLWRVLVCLLAAPGFALVTAQTHAQRILFESHDDLATARIAVLQGSAHDTYMSEHYPDAEILQYLHVSDTITAVLTGRADAGVSDEPFLLEIMKDNPQVAQIGDGLLAFDVAAGFRKDRTALRTDFNNFLAGLRETGVYEEMRARWLGGGEDRARPIDEVSEGEPLIIGTAIVGMPFSALQDNELVGFDIELGKLLGLELGRPVEFLQLDFGSLIAALASGRIDMIISCMYITEERRQRIDFSDPYFDMVMLAYGLRENIAAYADEAPTGPERGFLASVAQSFNDNILREQRYLLILGGLWVTIIISVFSTLLGTVLGAGVCWLRMSANPLLQRSGRVYISLMRGIPVLVLLMILYYVVLAPIRIDPIFVAIATFGLNFAGYAAEIYRAGLQSIDRGQSEAGLALGFHRLQVFRYILLPQTVQRVLPVYKGEVISLVKMTSIVGYVAVEDLTKVSDIIRARTYDAFFPLIIVAIIYFLITLVLIRVLDAIELRVHPGSAQEAESGP